MGGLDKMKKNVRDADSPNYQETLHRASDTVRTICLTLQDQVKNVWIDSISDKRDFVLKPHHVIAGLFGQYFNFARALCAGIGNQFFDYRAVVQGTGAAHRVVVYLMTHETLLKQLHTFTYTYTEAKPDLD